LLIECVFDDALRERMHGRWKEEREGLRHALLLQSQTSMDDVITPRAEHDTVVVAGYAPFFLSLYLLVKRSNQNIMRQPALLLNRVNQIIAFALILACFYAPMKTDSQYYTANWMNVMYEWTAGLFVGLCPSHRRGSFVRMMNGWPPQAC
jgi:hypothetical protein